MATIRRRACARRRSRFDYRQRFHKDVVIDMICYRKHGHNEGDDPSYTQPMMYRKIKAQKPVAAAYAERLEQEGLVTPEEVAGWHEAAEEAPLRDLRSKRRRTRKQYELQELISDARGVMPHDRAARDRDRTLRVRSHGRTRSPRSPPISICIRSSTALIEKRRAVLEGAPIDWALAELLAFGSLVLEGHAGASERAGFRPRHVQPAPRRISRLRIGSRVHAALRQTRRRSRSTTAL